MSDKTVYCVVETPDYPTTNADEMDVLGVFSSEEAAQKFIEKEKYRRMEEARQDYVDAPIEVLVRELDDISNNFGFNGVAIVTSTLFEDGE